MSEIKRICNQMKWGFEGEAWHGPSLLEILDGVDAQTAAAKPIPHAHSIWEIVLHIIATQKQLISRIEGNATELTPEEDWPQVADTSESAWRTTLDLLKQEEVKFREAVSTFSENQLDEPLNPGGSSAYNNFHGHVQHNLYHAGQIIMLKKAVTK
jgi:uncharacterized damage-inducible protein DinB